MKIEILTLSITFLLLLSAAGCRGTIPEALRQPAQEAIERAVRAPGIDLHVNIDGLISSGLNVGIEARINNPNPIILDIGNLEVLAKGGTGQTYIQDTVTGGSIAPNSSRTFTHSIVIPLDALYERNMIVTVDTRAGAAGITLPVSATITVNIPDIESLITRPGIALSVNIGQLPPDGLNVSLQANISNLNPLSLDIGDLQIVVKGQSGNVITTSTIIGRSIAPNSTRTLTSDLIIPLQVLNERSIIVTLDTSAGVAGITLPVSATVTVNIPDIQTIIRPPQAVIDAHYTIVPTLPLPSLKISTVTTIANNNNFGLIIGDLRINISRSDGTLLKRMAIAGGTIDANSSRTFSSSVTFGPDIIVGLIGSEYLAIELSGEVGISGINEKISIPPQQIGLRLPSLP